MITGFLSSSLSIFLWAKEKENIFSALLSIELLFLIVALIDNKNMEFKKFKTQNSQ